MLPVFFTGNFTRHQLLHFILQVRLAGPAKDHAILGSEGMNVYYKNWTKGSRKNVTDSMAKKYAMSEDVCTQSVRLYLLYCILRSSCCADY